MRGFYGVYLIGGEYVVRGNIFMNVRVDSNTNYRRLRLRSVVSIPGYNIFFLIIMHALVIVGPCCFLSM